MVRKATEYHVAWQGRHLFIRKGMITRFGICFTEIRPSIIAILSAIQLAPELVTQIISSFL